jgi:2-oxoglutarate dehydrogenase E1 component
VIGMAHRGRLSVLAHTIGQPYESILREFEGERTIEAVVSDPEAGSGDVKYHLGAQGVRPTAAGEITVTLCANPSHLEAVDPVVEGRTRAEQTDRSTKAGVHDPGVALPILIHGDASFAGQGVVAETLNIEGVAGYSTGGTLHLIANNQIGFTTDPEEARSTRYSSDLAKGFDIPIVHVNADDAEAAISSIRLAMAYRERFRKDFVVDLVGYRRFGHNEGDEPGYTQPLMYKTIETHPSLREQYSARLVEERVVTEEQSAELYEAVQKAMRDAHELLKASIEAGTAPQQQEERLGRGSDVPIETAVDGAILRELNDQLLSVPEGFTIHPKLVKQLERRRETVGEAGGIDWAQAEGLAFGSLVVAGTPIRLTGQDTERGTFSHRHLVLHDYESGGVYTPLAHLAAASAPVQVYNSPLSEMGAVGFEYGYSVACPAALVLWEAQFGDFVNSAQVMVDQFIVSGLSKWHQSSRLTLLLPHGYEGNGPEHSSARLERFMQLAAQENIRIVNCTTAAQYFHVLRRQALHPKARPLVLLTPKGLLRLKESTSKLEDLTKGGFRQILDDPKLDEERRRRAGRLVLCSGKVYYDIVGRPAHEHAEGIAIARLEQVYPFPVAAYDELLSRYPNITELIWAQEEPQNMGAWRAIRHRLEEGLPDEVRLRYVGRPWRASPSEGYPTAHALEQDRIAREALSVY